MAVDWIDRLGPISVAFAVPGGDGAAPRTSNVMFSNSSCSTLDPTVGPVTTAWPRVSR